MLTTKTVSQQIILSISQLIQGYTGIYVYRVYIYIYMCVCICVCVFLYIYIYIYMYIGHIQYMYMCWTMKLKHWPIYSSVGDFMAIFA